MKTISAPKKINKKRFDINEYNRLIKKGNKEEILNYIIKTDEQHLLD
jgi:hypothetical protein